MSNATTYPLEWSSPPSGYDEFSGASSIVPSTAFVSGGVLDVIDLTFDSASVANTNEFPNHALNGVHGTVVLTEPGNAVGLGQIINGNFTGNEVFALTPQYIFTAGSTPQAELASAAGAVIPAGALTNANPVTLPATIAVGGLPAGCVSYTLPQGQFMQNTSAVAALQVGNYDAGAHAFTLTGPPGMTVNWCSIDPTALPVA